MDQHSIIASSRELDGLVSRVRYLCIAGFIMSLNIICQDERAVVDLHVDLGFIQPPVYRHHLLHLCRQTQCVFQVDHLRTTVA